MVHRSNISLIADYDIEVEDVVVEWVIAYGIRKFMDLFIWAGVYCLFCCRHRKKMQRKIARHEMVALP